MFLPESLSISLLCLGSGPEFYLWTNPSPIGSDEAQAPDSRARAYDPGQRQWNIPSSGYTGWFRDEHVT